MLKCNHDTYDCCNLMGTKDARATDALESFLDKWGKQYNLESGWYYEITWWGADLHYRPHKVFMEDLR